MTERWVPKLDFHSINTTRTTDSDSKILFLAYRFHIHIQISDVKKDIKLKCFVGSMVDPLTIQAAEHKLRFGEVKMQTRLCRSQQMDC